ncbi:hypothetical protein EHQ43_06065 [Leptospira bouyouniensis]|uniref:DUF6602 domain-containing protein n=1 Tax=Leptospira bouyouniensis TaxID=2484911 RepID=A0A7I0IR52_9LEPT|nr:DUF6602 domain-containing protein [Leptospira bouyouniensis]TGL07494.1 hypothetical protein EHQ43_06065 [Leptospira bouyouniensis]
MTLPIQNKLKEFFKAKHGELMALSKQAITGNSNINGNHRELIIDRYLREILPKRFDIGSGIVHGMISESSQSDVVIWDSHNYPSIKMQGNSIYFTESVRACVEVKTNFNQDELSDLKLKTDKLRETNIAKHYHPTIKEELQRIEQSIYELQSGIVQSGMLIIPDRSASIGFFFNGGKKYSIDKLTKEEIEVLDDDWPDLIILLEAGVVIFKYIEEKNVIINGEERIIDTPYLKQINCGEDSLLLFTAKLLSLLSERVVNIENYSYFEDYTAGIFNSLPSIKIEYPIKRFLPGTRYL